VTRDEIFARVRTVVAAAVNIDEHRVQGSSVIIADLDAESIDFLDIVFRLEREFQIKIPRGELFPEQIGHTDFVSHGKVTLQGLAYMRERMPYADLTDFEREPSISQIGDIFTVDLVCQYIMWKLAQPRKQPF